MQTLSSTLPSQLPSQARPDTLDSDTENLFNALPVFAAGADAIAANLNAIAAGGAYAIPYTFSTTTTDADPGAGFMRLDNATQSSATTMRLDLLGSNGVDYTTLLDAMDSASSSVKGQARIIKVADPTKFLAVNVTARAAPSGYRNISISYVGISGANPFANGDAVILQFQRTGDKGDQGVSGFSNMVVLRTTQTWTSTVSRAKITVVDGGQGGGVHATINNAIAGSGGNGSVSVRTLTPGTVYTATVGAGGTGTTTGAAGNSGGSSSFSGTGLTTLTSTNGDVNVPGSPPVLASAGGAQCAGGSLLSNHLIATANANSTAIGQGGPGAGAGSSTAFSGAAGAIIIEY